MAWLDMRVSTSKTWSGIFICIVIIFIAYDIIKRPRILIVYSYKPDSTWVREEEAAIKAVFDNSNERPSVRRHYLGMDKTWSGRTLDIIKSDVERSVTEFKPHIIISMDDEARTEIARDYAGRKDINVIFGGVDETKEWHPFFEQENVTGVLEKLPLSATQELLNHIYKRNVNILVFGDGSFSARAEAKQILSYDWGESRIITSIQVKEFEGWKDKLDANIGGADLVFITGYRQLKRSHYSDDVVKGEEVIAWTASHTNKMLISNDMKFIQDGGVVTLACSPREQGREVARLALQVISGRTIKDIPIVTGNEFFVLLSKGRLADRSIVLPEIYESAAQASGTLYP